MNERRSPRHDGGEVVDHKSAEQAALGHELDRILGSEEFKTLGQDLAFVIANHKLTREPEICEKVFRYMSFVISGWNSL